MVFMLLKIIRLFVGKLILFLDWVFSPATPVRSVADQARVDAATAGLVIYQYEACPFCVKVRRAMKRLGVKIELRDAARSAEFREELVKGGGKNQVPCLRIPEGGGGFRWMYESGDIVRFLEGRVTATAAVA